MDYLAKINQKLKSWNLYQLSLHWRHNDHDSVSNHQPHGCLLKRLFRRRSKKTSKLRVTGLCVGNSPGPVNSPHKGPVTRKMFQFDDAIMFIPFVHRSCICWGILSKIKLIHRLNWNSGRMRFQFETYLVWIVYCKGPGTWSLETPINYRVDLNHWGHDK